MSTAEFDTIRYSLKYDAVKKLMKILKLSIVKNNMSNIKTLTNYLVKRNFKGKINKADILKWYYERMINKNLSEEQRGNLTSWSDSSIDMMTETLVMDEYEGKIDYKSLMDYFKVEVPVEPFYEERAHQEIDDYDKEIVKLRNEIEERTVELKKIEQMKEEHKRFVREAIKEIPTVYIEQRPRRIMVKPPVAKEIKLPWIPKKDISLKDVELKPVVKEDVNKFYHKVEEDKAKFLGELVNVKSKLKPVVNKELYDYLRGERRTYEKLGWEDVLNEEALMIKIPEDVEKYKECLDYVRGKGWKSSVVIEGKVKDKDGEPYKQYFFNRVKNLEDIIEGLGNVYDQEVKPFKIQVSYGYIVEETISTGDNNTFEYTFTEPNTNMMKRSIPVVIKNDSDLTNYDEYIEKDIVERVETTLG
jgi:hypothetical protein